MTIDEMVALLNQDLQNEYKHHLFYLHAFNSVRGMERVYLSPWLKKQSDEESEHVQEFASKIVALGATPVSGLQANQFPVNLTSTQDILTYALAMEQEVVANYHTRHAQATALYESTGQYYDLVVFLEDQIEDSQNDIDEMVKWLGTKR